MPVERVLCFAAHPDDLDFGAAGTVAAWSAAGVEVQYCIMTDGDAGGFDPGHRERIVEMRHDEQRQAAKTVGVGTVHFLGQRDGFLEPSHEVVREVVSQLAWGAGVGRRQAEIVRITDTARATILDALAGEPEPGPAR